jgi:negative regulator of replication initiation
MARFKLSNQWRTCKTDKGVFIEVLRALHRRVPDLFAQLQGRLRTRARTFFARVPDELFLRSPHLVDKQANYHQIVPGWFADTNLADRTKERILIQACAIAGVSYAGELEIEFNPGHHAALSKADMDALWVELDAP